MFTHITVGANDVEASRKFYDAALGALRGLGYRAAVPITDEQFADEREGVLDALPAHIALIAPDGTIVTVNEPWRRFARENGLPGDDDARAELDRQPVEGKDACAEGV